jgi:hypothetical protein
VGVILALSALTLGAALTRRVRFPLYPFEAAALAVVLGMFCWSWLALVAALLAPYDVALPLVVTFAFGVTVAAWQGPGPAWRPLEGGRRAWAAWAAATAVTGTVFARLFWTHSLPRDADGVWSAGATWADFGLHAAIVNHMAAAGELPGDLPVASGERLTYPFLVDFLSALYVHAGLTLHESLFWPGLLLALAACQLVMAVALRMFGHVGVAVGGLFLALTTGSAAGAKAAWDDWRESGKGLGAFLGDLPRDYSQIGERNAHVTNLVADAMLPQRAILFGLGVGLAVLVFLHAARDRAQPRLLWPAAGLVGLLPMAHPHTFLVAVGLLVALAAEAAWRSRALPREHLLALGAALTLAAPQVAWQQLANEGGTGGRFRFAWMRGPGESLPGYWWANFGLMSVAFVAVPLVLWRTRLGHERRAELIWFAPMLVVLAVTQLYAFQPFEYDNLKLLYWVYVLAALFLAYLALELVRRSRALLAVVLPVALLVATPGALAITREFQLRDQFASVQDVELAAWVRRNTPPGAVFAAADRPNVPVATLAGRTVVLGYRGWLYNFTVPYGEREAAVRAGFAGRFDDPGLRRHGADYLLVGAYEGPEWTVDRAALAKRPALWSNDAWTVYDLGN